MADNSSADDAASGVSEYSSQSSLGSGQSSLTLTPLLEKGCYFCSPFMTLARNYIQTQPRYIGPMETFMENEERIELLSVPLEQSPYLPRRNPRQPEGSITEAEYSGSTLCRTMHPYGASSSSLPTLDNSQSDSSASTVSTTSNAQMWNLPGDGNGGLYTHRHQAVGAPIRTVGQTEGIYPCLFAFNMCPEPATSGEAWISHVNSHFTAADVAFPSTSTCSICGKPFQAYTAKDNWSRFLNHLLTHYTRDRFSQNIPPHPDFLAYCREMDLISEFTSGRCETAQRTPSEHDRTPRSYAGGIGATAEVFYPTSWENAEPSPRTATTVMVNREGRRGGRH